MLDSQKFAVAAHMHVLLRRKTGRVTDTEWMVQNADYAREVLRFARARAREDADADLAEQADRLEKVLLAPAGAAAGAPASGGETALDRLRARHAAQAGAAPAPRYVGGLR